MKIAKKRENFVFHNFFRPGVEIERRQTREKLEAEAKIQKKNKINNDAMELLNKLPNLDFLTQNIPKNP